MRSVYHDMRYVKVYIMISFEIQAAKMHPEDVKKSKKREREEHTEGRNPADRNGRSKRRQRKKREMVQRAMDW